MKRRSAAMAFLRLITIIVAAIAGAWGFLCCIIAMAFFIKGQAR